MTSRDEDNIRYLADYRRGISTEGTEGGKITVTFSEEASAALRQELARHDMELIEFITQLMVHSIVSQDLIDEGFEGPVFRRPLEPKTRTQRLLARMGMWHEMQSAVLRKSSEIATRRED